MTESQMFKLFKLPENDQVFRTRDFSEGLRLVRNVVETNRQINMTIYDVLIALGVFSCSSVVSYIGYKLAMYYTDEKPMREFREKYNLKPED